MFQCSDNIWYGGPYVGHMFRRCWFLHFCCVEKVDLFPSLLSSPPTNASMAEKTECAQTSGIGSLSFWLRQLFYSDEKQTCRKERQGKTKGAEVKGVSWQSLVLVIPVTLGLGPPFTWVWLYPLAWWPPPLHPHTHTTVRIVIFLSSWQKLLWPWHTFWVELIWQMKTQAVNHSNVH